MVIKWINNLVFAECGVQLSQCFGNGHLMLVGWDHFVRNINTIRLQLLPINPSRVTTNTNRPLPKYNQIQYIYIYNNLYLVVRKCWKLRSENHTRVWKYHSSRSNTKVNPLIFSPPLSLLNICLLGWLYTFNKHMKLETSDIWLIITYYNDCVQYLFTR